MNRVVIAYGISCYSSGSLDRRSDRSLRRDRRPFLSSIRFDCRDSSWLSRLRPLFSTGYTSTVSSQRLPSSIPAEEELTPRGSQQAPTWRWESSPAHEDRFFVLLLGNDASAARIPISRYHKLRTEDNIYEPLSSTTILAICRMQPPFACRANDNIETETFVNFRIKLWLSKRCPRWCLA
jgi:hypothetical protein